MELTQQQRNGFLETLWSFYGQHKRDLPWRTPDADGSFDPYKIMVSELMLQQTQVARVIPKYRDFLQRFPTVDSLAEAEVGDVLRTWQGLGYNRRAKFLWQAAQAVHALGYMPDTVAALIQLPGIGTNTAGAILAYAYDYPAVFVETNVRTVYIHHFFSDEIDIPDRAITELVTQTIDTEYAREFYWALMDYGSYLKIALGNLSKASKHYAKQSTFKGSRRQLRGQIIRIISKEGQTLPSLHSTIPDERLESVLNDLVSEGLVRIRNGVYVL